LAGGKGKLVQACSTVGQGPQSITLFGPPGPLPGARPTASFDPLLPFAGLQHAQRGDDIAGRQVFREPVSASSSLTMSSNVQLAPQSSGAGVPAKRSAIQAIAANALFIAAVPWPTPGRLMKVTRLPAAQSLPM
jgi:hypothetical protein